MSFRTTLTLWGGQIAERSKINHRATPQVGDRIWVGYARGLALAQVTAVRTQQGPNEIDDVDVQEMI
jgi:hypothetical protein